jgi:hypothetical protein
VWTCRIGHLECVLWEATSVSFAGSGQAERTVRPATDDVLVGVILAVIFPVALIADFEGSALGQRPAAAAWAR